VISNEAEYGVSKATEPPEGDERGEINKKALATAKETSDRNNVFNVSSFQSDRSL